MLDITTKISYLKDIPLHREEKSYLALLYPEDGHNTEAI
jgi:hypothetical protein